MLTSHTARHLRPGVAGLSYAQIASQIGSTEQQVTNSEYGRDRVWMERSDVVLVCTGATTPSQAEFNAIAKVLGINSPVSQGDGA